MFTGIIEELGEVADVASAGESAVLVVRAPLVAADVRHGASVAVNGVCLTVIGAEAAALSFDVMAETLKRSVIGVLRGGEQVNLERAVRADARLDGHIVQGHVDGTGVVIARAPGDAWESVRFGIPAELSRYVAEKGSIAVDGVSLTVTDVGPDWFEVGLIPETLRATTLGARHPGDPVNIEVDVLAKYVARLTEVHSERASQARSAEERNERRDERSREEQVDHSERASQARSAEERNERRDERSRAEQVDP